MRERESCGREKEARNERNMGYVKRAENFKSIIKEQESVKDAIASLERRKTTLVKKMC